MKTSLLYRAAAVLMLLFAVLHGISFRQNVPEWKADSVMASMQSVHFDALGFDRTYWDFYSGFGFFMSIFLVLTAFLAWQLGGASAEPHTSFTRGTAWALVITFVAVTAVSVPFAFTIPLAFASVITVLLIVALWGSTGRAVLPGPDASSLE